MVFLDQEAACWVRLSASKKVLIPDPPTHFLEMKITQRTPLTTITESPTLGWRETLRKKREKEQSVVYSKNPPTYFQEVKMTIFSRDENHYNEHHLSRPSQSPTLGWRDTLRKKREKVQCVLEGNERSCVFLRC